jgi:hypothetical protein
MAIPYCLRCVGVAGVEGGGVAVIRAGGGRQEAAVAESGKQKERKKVAVVVAAGWAGLGAAHHLTKQVRKAPHSAQLLQLNFVFLKLSRPRRKMIKTVKLISVAMCNHGCQCTCNKLWQFDIR